MIVNKLCVHLRMITVCSLSVTNTPALFHAITTLFRLFMDKKVPQGQMYPLGAKIIFYVTVDELHVNMRSKTAFWENIRLFSG